MPDTGSGGESSAAGSKVGHGWSKSLKHVERLEFTKGKGGATPAEEATNWRTFRGRLFLYFIPALLNNWIITEKTQKTDRKPTEKVNMGTDACPTLKEYDGFGLEVDVDLPPQTNATNR